MLRDRFALHSLLDRISGQKPCLKEERQNVGHIERFHDFAVTDHRLRETAPTNLHVVVNTDAQRLGTRMRQAIKTPLVSNLRIT